MKFLFLIRRKGTISRQEILSISKGMRTSDLSGAVDFEILPKTTQRRWPGFQTCFVKCKRQISRLAKSAEVGVFNSAQILRISQMSCETIVGVVKHGSFTLIKKLL